MKTVSAILTADWHVRTSTPVCREDNFLESFEQKVLFIKELSQKHNCPVLIAGDIGDRHQWPNWLLEWFITLVRGMNIIAIPGQHDIPNHRLEDINRSGVGVLSATDTIDLRMDPSVIALEKDFNLIAFPYSRPIDHFKIKGSLPVVAITHQMVIEDKPLWPGQEAIKGNQLLRKFPEYDLVLVGDNHNSFVAKYKGRVLVNPGSLMRTTSAQVDHKPRVYLWWADTNEVEAVYLPIKEGVVSREHIEVENERDERMEAYLERMETDYEIGFSYEKNLEKHLEVNKIEEEVETKIWENVV